MGNRYRFIFTVSIILFPSFFGYVGLNTGQAIYLAFILLLSFIPFLVNSMLVRRHFFNRGILFIGSLFLLLFIEYSVSSILNFNRNSYGLNDIIEIFRPLIYLFCFLTSYILVNRNPSERAYKFIDTVEKIVFFSSFFEWLKFNKVFYPFFKLYLVFAYGFPNYIRMSGTTGFAYSYAWVIIFCLFWNVLRNGKITFKFFYYSFLVLLTGSRTGFAALCASYAVIFFSVRKTRKTLGISLLIITITMFVLYFSNVEVVVTAVDYILRLIKTFLGKSSDASMLTRQSQNAEALRYFDEAALFGVASNKSKNVLIENFYFHHIRNWGLLGLTLYLMIFILFFLLSKKSYRSFVFVMMTSAFLICFSAPLFDEIRIFNILYLVLAACVFPNSDVPIIASKKRRKFRFAAYFAKV